MQVILARRVIVLVVSLLCFSSRPAQSHARDASGDSNSVKADAGTIESRRLSLLSTPGDKWCQVWCPNQRPMLPPVGDTDYAVQTPVVQPTVQTTVRPPIQTTVQPPIQTTAQSPVTVASSSGNAGNCNCRPGSSADQGSSQAAMQGTAGASGQRHHYGESDQISGSDLLTERVISAMTLGAVAFQMSLFYIINHRDHDIKRYALSVIGQTISIFCAVLTFSTVFGVVEESLSVAPVYVQVILCVSLPILFWLLMQVSIMIAGRVRGDLANKPVHVSYTRTQIFELEIPAHVLNAKMFGTGAAQMCAAATIRGIGHIQLLVLQEEHSRIAVLLMCPISFWALFLIAWLSGWLRRIVILWDDEIDEAEKTWIEVAEQCEDEVIGLSCGFYSAVGARLLITDSLPIVLLRGFEHRRSLEVADLSHSILLWLAGVGCAFACIFLNVMAFGVLKKGINMKKLRSDNVGRVLRVFTLSIGMTFAWCMCFGAHLLSIHIPYIKEGVQLRLLVALVQSFACFLVIIFLDFLADMKFAGPAFDKALVMIICALGSSVGLSWEQAFHECARVAVDFMAEDRLIFRASDDPKVWGVGLAACIVVAVLPAYRFYIVPRMYQMIEEHEATLAAQESVYRTTHGQGEGELGQLSENLFMWAEEPPSATADEFLDEQLRKGI